MPREAPVTRAMRLARGAVIENNSSGRPLRTRGPIRRDGYDGGRCLCLMASVKRRPVVMGPRDDASMVLDRLRQQRELTRLRLGFALVGEVGRIGACKTVIAEFRIG